MTRHQEFAVMQERAQRTRDVVLAAAAAVFERSGYTAARLDEIAERAEVTKGALYFHFASKADLANAIVTAHHDRWRTLLAAAETWDLPALATLERLILELGASYRSEVIARAGVRLGNEYLLVDTDLPRPFVDWNQHVLGLLEKGHQDGSVSTRIDPASASRWLVASFFGIQDVSARTTARRDIDERLTEWWQIVGPVIAAGPAA